MVNILSDSLVGNGKIGNGKLAEYGVGITLSNDEMFEKRSFKMDSTFITEEGNLKKKDNFDEDFDPLREEVPDNERTNYGQTLMNLLNGIIGSCVLSMPLAFKNGGWLVSAIVVPIIGLISAYCIHLLLAVNVCLMKQTNQITPFDYHELAEKTFLYGPKRLRSYSRTARIIVIITIVGTQVGACCVYYVFIATNLATFLANRFGPNAPKESLCLLFILPIVIGINWIRNIRYLSYLSTLSNVLQVAGISIVVYNLVTMPIQSLDRLPPVGDKIPQFFVTTLFIFEGSSVSMSLYKTIRTHHHFRMTFGVLNVGELIVMLFYTSIGFLGYLQYGEDTEGTITSSLPASPLYDAVQLVYAVVVLGTYPIILYVPIQVLWNIIKQKVGPILNGNEWNGVKSQGGARLMIIELVFRALLVVATYLLSVVVPQLDLIISLVGAITSSSVAVMIPSILHTVTFWEQNSNRWARIRLLAVNLVLFAIGLTAFTLGIYFSVSDIIDSYRTIEFINETTLPSSSVG